MSIIKSLKCAKCGSEPQVLWNHGKFSLFCPICDSKIEYNDAIITWNARQKANKSAYWEKIPPSYSTSVCSYCYNYWISTEDQYDFDYCPHCGARMNKEIPHE